MAIAALVFGATAEELEKIISLIIITNIIKSLFRRGLVVTEYYFALSINNNEVVQWIFGKR